jgi:spore maturation protein CgeB
MKKTVLYLGGAYSAEYSLMQSFKDNSAKLIFFIGDDIWSQYYKKNKLPHFKNSSFIREVTEEHLEEEIKELNPHAVIHRMYLGEPYTYPNAREVCKKLKIPYIKYDAETDYHDIKEYRFEYCDFALFAHNTIHILNSARRTKTKCYFYPYGVSSVESNQNLQDRKSFGIIGNLYKDIDSRIKNLDLFLQALQVLNYKANVYSEDWNESPNYIKNHIILNKPYKIEDSCKILNQHRIILNVESISDIDGAYTHKIFQSMGCGIPTITNSKESLKDLFGVNGENLIYVKNKDDIIYAIHTLFTNEKFMKEMSIRCEKYMHENFDWFKRLNEIFIKEGVWD